jgi:hypothetical protein
MRVNTATTVAVLLVLTAGCDSEARDSQGQVVAQTERGPVSLADRTVSQVGLRDFEFPVPSCHGEPKLDLLEQDDRQVRVRIVTTVSAIEPDCEDRLTVTLEDQLDGRSVIDLVSGEPLAVDTLDIDVEPQTERGTVSLEGTRVGHASPTELDITVQSCGGDPTVDILEEDDDQVRIQVVTTVVTGGPTRDCLDALTLHLQEPLGDRIVIDLVSGQPLDTRP